MSVSSLISTLFVLYFKVTGQSRKLLSSGLLKVSSHWEFFPWYFQRFMVLCKGEEE